MVPALLGALDDEALSSSCQYDGKGGCSFLWTLPSFPSCPALAARFSLLSRAYGGGDVSPDCLICKPLDSQIDWLAESYRALPSFSVGPFFIFGDHHEGVIPPEGALPLKIEAATAFGSGDHGTTAACLLALNSLKNKGCEPERILDMGCGSGILAIAASRLWPQSDVSAADNDPESVRVSLRHCRENKADAISVFQSEGYAKESPVWMKAPYQLIVANILAAPLIEMAAEQSACVAEAGYLILSGMLEEQKERVAAAYESFGFAILEQFPRGEWVTLLLQKKMK